MLELDRNLRAAETPSRAAARNEEEQVTLMALTLLAPEKRDLILLRTVHDLEDKEIGRRLGISAEAARKRRKRAAAEVARIMDWIRSGDISSLADHVGPGARSAGKEEGEGRVQGLEM